MENRDRYAPGCCWVCGARLPKWGKRYCSEPCRAITRRVGWKAACQAPQAAPGAPIAGPPGEGILERIVYLLERQTALSDGRYRPIDGTVAPTLPAGQLPFAGAYNTYADVYPPPYHEWMRRRRP